MKWITRERARVAHRIGVHAGTHPGEPLGVGHAPLRRRGCCDHHGGPVGSRLRATGCQQRGLGLHEDRDVRGAAVLAGVRECLADGARERGDALVAERWQVVGEDDVDASGEAVFEARQMGLLE